MAEWHLDELRGALARRGWRIAAELPGNDYDVSAAWLLERSGSASLVIEFQGLDDLLTLPLTDAYGCRARGHPGVSMYFGRKGQAGSTRQGSWAAELSGFVQRLDSL